MGKTTVHRPRRPFDRLLGGPVESRSASAPRAR